MSKHALFAAAAAATSMSKSDAGMKKDAMDKKKDKMSDGMKKK